MRLTCDPLRLAQWRAQDCLRASGPLGVFVEEDCHNSGGGVAGGQVGYRWQFGGAPMVWGLEAQGDWASLSGSHVSLIDPTITNRTKLQGFGLFSQVSLVTPSTTSSSISRVVPR